MNFRVPQNADLLQND